MHDSTKTIHLFSICYMDSFSIKYFMQLRQTNKLCALNFLGRMAGESLHLPCNGVILTHSSKGPELSLRGQSNGK